MPIPAPPSWRSRCWSICIPGCTGGPAVRLHQPALRAPEPRGDDESAVRALVRGRVAQGAFFRQSGRLDVARSCCCVMSCFVQTCARSARPRLRDRLARLRDERHVNVSAWARDVIAAALDREFPADLEAPNRQPLAGWRPCKLGDGWGCRARRTRCRRARGGPAPRPDPHHRQPERLLDGYDHRGRLPQPAAHRRPRLRPAVGLHALLDTLSVAQVLTAGGIDRDRPKSIANARRRLAERGDERHGRSAARNRLAPDPSVSGASLPFVCTKGWRRGRSVPLEPPADRRAQLALMAVVRFVANRLHRASEVAHGAASVFVVALDAVRVARCRHDLGKLLRLYGWTGTPGSCASCNRRVAAPRGRTVERLLREGYTCAAGPKAT